MKKIRKELSILEFKKGTIIELNKMKTIIGGGTTDDTNDTQNGSDTQNSN